MCSSWEGSKSTTEPIQEWSRNALVALHLETTEIVSEAKRAPADRRESVKSAISGHDVAQMILKIRTHRHQEGVK